MIKNVAIYTIILNLILPFKILAPLNVDVITDGNLANVDIMMNLTGFIGSNLCKRLLTDNKNIIVIGLDNMNDYYDVKLKEYRLNELTKYYK